MRLDYPATWGRISPEKSGVELNTKGRYAVMALADLASQAASQSASGADDAAVPLSQIAERQNLPLAYLEQLFVPLRRARGRTGGYRLARAASEISVSAVLAAVEEGTRFTRCSEENPGCVRDAPCLTHGLWQALGDVTSKFFDSTSLADVVSGATVKPRATQPSPPRTYLDYNATAPLRASAKAAMIAALDATGNPSSVHSEGRKARAIVEAARESVARLVGAKPSEIVFTSGATESNAFALAQPFDTIFVAGIEHDSVFAAARANGAEVVTLSATSDGLVRVEEIAERVLKGGINGRGLVALQMANNETGVIQPVAEAARFARDHGLLVHTDAVQAAGRIAIDFAELSVDTLSLSAHKLGGPKGIGALVIRDHLDLVPLLRGGGQERRRRAGTENLPAIAGFGAAAGEAVAQLGNVARIARLRDELEAAVRAIAPEAVMTNISEALVATAVGLLVAIPAVAAFNTFQRIVRTTTANTEALTHVLLAYLKAIPGVEGTGSGSTTTSGGGGRVEATMETAAARAERPSKNPRSAKPDPDEERN